MGWIVGYSRNIGDPGSYKNVGFGGRWGGITAGTIGSSSHWNCSTGTQQRVPVSCRSDCSPPVVLDADRGDCAGNISYHNACKRNVRSRWSCRSGSGSSSDIPGYFLSASLCGKHQDGRKWSKPSIQIPRSVRGFIVYQGFWSSSIMEHWSLASLSHNTILGPVWRLRLGYHSCNSFTVGNYAFVSLHQRTQGRRRKGDNVRCGHNCRSCAMEARTRPVNDGNSMHHSGFPDSIWRR